MLRNFFWVTLRHFQKQKLASIVNIAGLTLGITCCLYIILFVNDELKYDQFQLNKDRIYRLILRNNLNGEQSPLQPAVLFSKTLNAVPEFERGFRIVGAPERYSVISYNNKRFNENLYYSDPEIFSVFTLSLERGNSKTALNDPFTVVITPAIARKYFGDENPIGKTLTLENKYDLKVTGIIKEIPQHSHIRPSLIASINTLNVTNPVVMNENWASSAYFYFLLKQNADKHTAERKIEKIYNEIYGKNVLGKPQYILEPLSDIYLYSTDTRWDIAEHGDIDLVKSFIAVGFLIILMAAFNYTNLLTVFVKVREKELSVRKIMGAGKRDIIKQFLFETLLLLFISLGTALSTADLFMNGFNQITGKHFVFSSLFQWEVIIPFSLILCLIEVISVIYPSFITFRTNTIYRLKGGRFNPGFNFSRLTIGFRQAIIFFQFAITTILISAALIIFHQMNYIKNAKLGFNKEQLLKIENPYDEKMFDRYQNYKNKILQYPQVLSVAAGGNLPGENINNYTDPWLKSKSQSERVHSAVVAIDYDYMKTMQVKFLNGRDFSREISSDADKSIIITKAAAEAFGLKDPIGAEFNGINNASWPQQVIGEIDDIHFKSFKEKVMPIIFYLRSWSALNIVVRIKSNDIPATINNLQDEWSKVFPDRPFMYSFIDESFNKLYSSEQKTIKLVFTFCSIAIIICAIGLLGLITIVSQMRKKEIGIRKVLGASVTRVLVMMLKEYAYIIIAANIAAFPVAYYFLNMWLQKFVYRIEIDYKIFFVSSLLSLLIGLIVMSVRVYKAAIDNPVDSLKYE